MTTRTRYCVEDGRSCIDLEVQHSRQLFDTRDPAPFHERDLDADAVEYLLAAAQEIPRKRPLAVVVTISEEPEPRLTPEMIVEAVRGHFIYEGEQVERRLREHVRRGQMFLGVGLGVKIASGDPDDSYKVQQTGQADGRNLVLWQPHLRSACARLGRAYACSPDQSLETAMETMRQEKVRRLPVVDSLGMVEGILSIRDLVMQAQPAVESVGTAALTCDEVVETLKAISDASTRRGRESIDAAIPAAALGY